ncbi:MAG TPA: transglycosylase SLT domain-containing protein [Mariprofundaceae bacterium]|nr:transglycosylase SLT domain-containing protein [Mariprofundaceae bacterium]
MTSQGKPIGDPKGAEKFAAWQVDQAQKTKTIKTEDGDKTVFFVDMAMVSNFEDKQAKKYQPAVQRFASKFGISESLVFGVIRTESNFNPYAVSGAPAFGLMQLVPSSGGREGYKKARGKDSAPSRDFLFDAENNIELGAAYLGVQFGEQLSEVYNNTSREYCVIAAYNTGPSNVLKAFSKSRSDALDQINRSQPPQVYDKLVHNLPYKETRSYLQKVVKYRRDYVRL